VSRSSSRKARPVAPGPVAILADVPPGDDVALPPHGERVLVGFHLGTSTFVHRDGDGPRCGPHPVPSYVVPLAHYPRVRSPDDVRPTAPPASAHRQEAPP
jgi:hypothetical protein